MIKASQQVVLLVDPESDFLEWATQQISAPEVRVLSANSAEKAYEIFTKEKPDLTITETHLQPFSGQELLTRIRKHSPNALVIVTSAFGTTQAVIETMRLGAFDFVRKEQLPFNLRAVVEAALKSSAELRRAETFAPVLTVEQYQDEIVGKSDAMQEVFKMIGRVSGSEAAVMITGESGSGKEIVARAIHNYSARKQSGFLAINCAAIPDNLLESELFGHEKGAFTGAFARRIGRFEQADGGTLFLDEIGEMPLATQSKLLRVLQEGEVTRLGSNESVRVDVRILAATNKNLEEEITAKTFREDLFYRLNVVRIHLPPLRERVEDIRPLAEYFLRRTAHHRHTPIPKLSEEAAKTLERHFWPGNVRELENTLERACVFAATDVLLPGDIPFGSIAEKKAAGRSPDTEQTSSEDELIDALFTRAESSGAELLPWLERVFTIRAMEKTGNNQLQAAKLLGITRATLRKRLERIRAEGG